MLTEYIPQYMELTIGYSKHHQIEMGLGSSVGIATNCKLDCPGIESADPNGRVV
jgi:hypothetical protein